MCKLCTFENDNEYNEITSYKTEVTLYNDSTLKMSRVDGKEACYLDIIYCPLCGTKLWEN